VGDTIRSKWHGNTGDMIDLLRLTTARFVNGKTVVGKPFVYNPA
jgi:hypothetical protein